VPGDSVSGLATGGVGHLISTDSFGPTIFNTGLPLHPEVKSQIGVIEHFGWVRGAILDLYLFATERLT